MELEYNARFKEYKVRLRVKINSLVGPTLFFLKKIHYDFINSNIKHSKSKKKVSESAFKNFPDFSN